MITIHNADLDDRIEATRTGIDELSERIAATGDGITAWKEQHGGRGPFDVIEDLESSVKVLEMA